MVVKKKHYFVLHSTERWLYLYRENSIIINYYNKQQTTTGLRATLNYNYLMKKIFLCALMSLLCASAAMAADGVRGRVINQKSEPVSYATVVAMVGVEQKGGATTDEKGEFVMRLADGEYRLVVEFVGYKSHEQTIKVEQGGCNVGDVVLREAATDIGEVVVKATMIRREADRYVVDVANSDAAIGKDGVELLRQSPGVWVKDDGLSINGTSGTKVYINERELRMSGEELISYLRNIKAEDIAKIEIVPQTGADYDANSSGGIIKITLRRRLDNGVMGNVSMNTSHSDLGSDISPSASINAHLGRFDLSASGGYYRSRTEMEFSERTQYFSPDALMSAESDDAANQTQPWTTISAVADVNPRHSLGASYSYWNKRDGNTTLSTTQYAASSYMRLSESEYRGSDDKDSHSALFNYIFKSDTLGSTLKFIADYTARDGEARVDKQTLITEQGTPMDSLYYDRTGSSFRVATAQLARERIFSPKFNLKYGAKYTYNQINSDATYRYLLGQEWVPSIVDDYDVSYTENIAAAYAVASMRFGRLSAVMGLRGEYTNAEGKSGNVSQNYFSLFPNANVSYAIDKMGKHSLVAQYSRTISRPSFWHLTPNRIQISDYTYQTGNPLLDPSYNNTFSLTGVMNYKYSVTFVASIQRDAIQQMIVSDPIDNRMMNLTVENLPKFNTYILNVSLPFTLTKWWDWDINASGLLWEQQLTSGAPITHQWVAQCNTMMNFKLPKKFFIDLSYSAMTDVKVSNATLKANHNLSATLKKRIKDAWTLSCELVNIISPAQNLIFEQDGFERMITNRQFENDFRVRFAASWNFKSGKQFNAKKVESGSQGEESRM